MHLPSTIGQIPEGRPTKKTAVEHWSLYWDNNGKENGNYNRVYRDYIKVIIVSGLSKS